MGWEDIFAALSGVSGGLAKGMSWQQEMDQEEARRRDAANQRGVADMMQQAEHAERMKAANDLAQERRFRQIEDLMGYQPLDRPLRGDFAEEARAAGFGGAMTERPGQLEANALPGSQIPSWSSAAVEGGTYRLPNAAERKGIGEALAAQQQRQRGLRELALLPPEQQRMGVAGMTARDLDISASWGEGLRPMTDVQEQGDYVRKQTLENQKTIERLQETLGRETTRINRDLPMTANERERTGYAASIAAQTAAETQKAPQRPPAPYTPKGPQEWQDIRTKEGIDYDTWLKQQEWERLHPKQSQSGTNLQELVNIARGGSPNTGVVGAGTATPTPTTPATGQLPITMPGTSMGTPEFTAPAGAARGAAPAPVSPAPAPVGAPTVDVNERPYGNYPSAGATPPPGVVTEAPPPRQAAKIGDKRNIGGIISVWTGSEWKPLPLPPK